MRKSTRTCTVLNCFDKHFAKDLCYKHYMRMWRNGDLLIHRGSKVYMDIPKATKSPTMKDIAWSAGFCEGEACFSSHHNSPQVIVTQTNCKEVLEKLQQFFGGSIYKKDNSKKFINGIQSKDSDYWGIYGERARGFMMTIYSFMSGKRKIQIKKALEYAQQN